VRRGQPDLSPRLDGHATLRTRPPARSLTLPDQAHHPFKRNRYVVIQGQRTVPGFSAQALRNFKGVGTPSTAFCFCEALAPPAAAARGHTIWACSCESNDPARQEATPKCSRTQASRSRNGKRPPAWTGRWGRVPSPGPIASFRGRSCNPSSSAVRMTVSAAPCDARRRGSVASILFAYPRWPR
jgi:hypothetical protein